MVSSGLYIIYVNVGFFDSAIMVRLRDLGCNRCDVYLDRFGYNNSLIERQSKFLGLYYRLHEISPPEQAGIFHPKLVHLWDAKGEEDVLLVGSGNLTFAGHGQQAEVLECISSREHGSAFVEAAAFFENLAETSRTSDESSESLHETSSRLREAGARGKATDEVRFIHSLGRPGIDQ